MPGPTPDQLPEEKRLDWALALELMGVGWNLAVRVAAVIVGKLRQFPRPVKPRG
jgi:hypothetical protein